jgi:hypothetical protein
MSYYLLLVALGGEGGMQTAALSHCNYERYIMAFHFTHVLTYVRTPDLDEQRRTVGFQHRSDDG